MTKTNGKTMKASAVSFEAYKAAADRIRRGEGRMGDDAICDRYDAQHRNPVVVKSIFDLPMAAGMWRADAFR